MVKRNPKAFVTNEVLDEAVNTLLKGMDNMFEEQKKYFVSKEDLKSVKNELKSEISWLKDDIKGLKADFSTTPSRSEFNNLKSLVSRNLASV